MELAKSAVTAYLPEEERCRLVAKIWGNTQKDVIQFSGEYEWYTPEAFMKPVHDVLGHIDLDSASCAKANELVKAEAYHTNIKGRWHFNYRSPSMREAGCCTCR